MEKFIVIAILIVCGFWIGRRMLRALTNPGCSSTCGCECSACPVGKNDNN